MSAAGEFTLYSLQDTHKHTHKQPQNSITKSHKTQDINEAEKWNNITQQYISQSVIRKISLKP